MTAYQIQRAVVIGSGTMGAAIAAHLANAGLRVTLLDIVPSDSSDRNRIVKEGWQRCLKARPSNLMSAEFERLVTLGNLEDDFDTVGSADWVLEAILEDLQIKQQLMARIDSARGARTIVTTNTSGIPIHAIASGRSKEFRAHFLGTHFFNPPRYLKLLEIIPTRDTSKPVLQAMTHIGEHVLGKGVVLCKDTPNFIGNRVAFGTGAFALDFILRNGYTVEEMDSLTGPLIGRPKTATFRLIDLVGVDVWDHVGRNLAPLIPDDALSQEYLKSPAPRELFDAMLERGWLGNKSGIGFYKSVRDAEGRKEFHVLDLNTMEHHAPSKPRFKSVQAAKDVEELGIRLKVLLDADDRAAQLIRALTYQAFQYCSTLIPEVADSPKPIDDAVRWGFMHGAGPFETWDMLGVRETVKRMHAEGYPPAPWVGRMLKAGIESFYGSKSAFVYDAVKKKTVRNKLPENILLLKNFRGTRREVLKNAGASLLDLGDGVALLEFHTKLNTLDEDIFELSSKALECLHNDFDGMIIGSEAENFSAGANLFMVVVAAQQAMWETLDAAVRRLQDLNMRMRYSAKPIVAAPAGLALGGGCEITMHASRVVAAAETYIGLVEVVAGIIPAGGGTKEMIRRMINPAMKTDSAEVQPFLQAAFLQIGQAKVSTSADEARAMKILSGADRIVLNRFTLLAEAKREVLHMHASGYKAPAPEPIFAAGRDALGALRVGAYMFSEGRYVTEFDRRVADQLALVLCGGELSKPAWVSEQYILDLEREVFLSLCGEEKTQARMWNLLQTGKPLRN